jgi:hypothetical protein
VKRIRVTVTQKDIDKGQRLTADTCPLARALHRRGFSGATVCWGRWFLAWEDTDTLSRGGLLSVAAVRFVTAFDRQAPVKPATFLLPVPE